MKAGYVIGGSAIAGVTCGGSTTVTSRPWMTPMATWALAFCSSSSRTLTCVTRQTLVCSAVELGLALLAHNQKFCGEVEIRVQVLAALAVAQVAEPPFSRAILLARESNFRRAT